jgi:hypothetical protein
LGLKVNPQVAIGSLPHLKFKMATTDSKHSSELKVDDVEKKQEEEISEPIDAHYDPVFVKKTLYVFSLVSHPDVELTALTDA